MKNLIIEWSQLTWNPVTGCTPISKGCSNCYAMPIAERKKFDGESKYSGGFKVALHQALLRRNFDIHPPSRIFVNSMSDLFHEEVPLEFIQDVFYVIESNPKHLFLVLTKRADIMYEYRNDIVWPNNLLLGVGVEDGNYTKRIELLQEMPAVRKVVFFEPPLGPITEVDLSGIECVFVGGESGLNYRRVRKEWVVGIQKQCEEQNCMFVFKQWGGNPRWIYGSRLNGRHYNKFPTVEIY